MKYSVVMNPDIAAPVKKGQALGKVSCSLDGSPLQEFTIRAKTAVEPITFSAVLKLFLKGLLMTG